MDDIKMESFPADTNAAAVILCDYGESKVNNEFEIVFKHHRRIKILNKNGFDWGTHSVIIYEDRDNGEEIDDIEGITYTLKNGKIVEKEFDDDEVFEEKLDDKHTRYKFTLPGLEPGCIVEIRYRIISKSLGNVKDWTFQKSEPVLWSEYRLSYPLMMAFAIVTHGYEALTVKEIGKEKKSIANDLAGYVGANVMNFANHRWAIKNVSAIRDEPYITTLDDYFNRLDIQFSKFANRMGGFTDVINTWDKLAEDMRENDDFGEQCEPTGKIEDLVGELVKGVSAEEEKLKTIYNWVAASIVNQGDHGKFATQSLNDILESKKGYSAEINFLLIAMLRAAGLSAHPAMVSTRSNGKIQELYPILSQFNHTIAVAYVSSKIFFLDANDPFRPYNLPAARVLGARAFVIKPELCEWQTVSSQTKSVTLASATLAIDEAGGASGTILGTFKDYANVNARKNLKEDGKSELAKNYFGTGESGFTIDSVETLKEDSSSLPLIIKCQVSSPTYGQLGGDLLYINPHIVSRWKDNPFKTKSRKFPVDYNYAREYTTIVNIAFPDSFELKEGLSNKEYSLLDNVVYRRQFAADSMRMQLVTKFSISQSVIEPIYYTRLKDLYASMIAAESEQIVLQRKRMPVPEPPPQIVEPQKPAPQKIKSKAGRKK